MMGYFLAFANISFALLNPGDFPNWMVVVSAAIGGLCLGTAIARTRSGE